MRIQKEAVVALGLLTKSKAIIVEGPQNSGKTFLINQKYSRHSYKYDFSTIYDLLKIDNPKINYGISIGKDIQLFNFLKFKYYTDIIVDRLFLSTIVYADIFKRANKKEILLYIDFINKTLKDPNIHLVVVFPKVKKERKRSDGFDGIDLDLQIKKYNYYLKLLKSKNIIIFENEFNEKSVNSFNKLIEGILAS